MTPAFNGLCALYLPARHAVLLQALYNHALAMQIDAILQHCAHMIFSVTNAHAHARTLARHSLMHIDPRLQLSERAENRYH